LDLGERALFAGDWDQALVEFNTALSFADDDPTRAQAQLGIGKTLLQAGRLDEALEAFTVYLSTYGEHEYYGQAHFLRAQTYEELGLSQEALSDYRAYLTSRPGQLDSYTQERIGDIYYAAKDYAGALEAYQAALVSPGLDQGLSAEIKAARTRADSGDYREAIAEYSAIYNKTSEAYLRALMDYLMGQAYTKLGEYDLANASYLDAVINYPSSYSSYEGLVILVNNGVAVNELDRGLVDYYAGQYGVALSAFDRYLYAFPEMHDGTVHYFKGLTLRALGNYDAAIQEWDVLITDHPEGPYWDAAWEEKAYTQWGYLERYPEAIDTLLNFAAAAPNHTRAAEFIFDAGRVSEIQGELAPAIGYWERAAAQYPDSTWSFRALFLAGIAQYRLNEMALAADAFQRSLAHVNSSDERAAAYLWIGKANEALGDSDSARAALQLASDADRGNYYSIRAADLLEGWEPFHIPESGFSFEYDVEEERAQAETWLRTQFVISGPEPLSSLSPALASDARMIRGKELWALGEYEDARNEFEALRQAYVNDAEATYRLMHTYLEIGLYRSAIYAAKQIMTLAGLDEAGTLLAPVYLSRIRFGVYFEDLFIDVADETDFETVFLLSVARQESLFEGFALSYAAARGLMQIVPDTGQYLADRFQWPPGYTADDLYRPYVSVRLGAQYLLEQRDLFDGDLYASLAAYNAGPGNSLAWKELAPDDPDLFLECVRFSQPRDYIRVIYWAFSNYRRLYGVE
jgi:soluble lytic murein transglycosylase